MTRLVYDGHCHVASTRFIPAAFLADVVGNIHRRLAAHAAAPAPDRLTDAYTAGHQDHHADRLVAEMDEAGVARSVLMVPDFGLRLDCPLPMTEMARLHHEIRLRHPGRFWVFIGADPRRGAEGLKQFEQMVDDYGFDGLKLYPPCGYSPSDRSLYPYYEACAERSLPVFVHTGPTGGSLDFEPAHPRLIDQAARDFPQIPFVLGHAGLTHVPEAAALAQHRPNVYLDIGGYSSAPTIADWPAHLNRLFRLGINHKIVFGTDWPLGRLSGGLRRAVGEVVHGPVVFDGVSSADQDLLLHGNLLRILAPASRPAAHSPDGAGSGGQ